MALLHLVLVLALLEFFLFGAAVSRARARYKVKAPAVSGDEMFERYYRVQQNTLEQLTMFVPGLFLFGWYLSSYVAAALGVVFIIGRALYFRGYVASPPTRICGFVLSLGPNLILLAGGGYGALRAFLTQFR